MPGDNNKLRQRQQLQEMARGYRQARILLTCVEVGVFDALSGRWASAEEVTETVGVNGRAAELLLNAAVALGLLYKRDARYSNSDLSEAHLTQNAVGGMARRLKPESAFYRRWGD